MFGWRQRAWSKDLVHRYRRLRKGQALIIAAVVLPLLIGMAALSVTMSTVYLAKAHLQNAVDAAALAGAQEMHTNDAAAPGDQTYLIQQTDLSAQDPCVATLPSTCGLNMTAIPNTVVATAIQEVPASFAGIFGFKNFTVRAVAVAEYGPGEPFDYAVFQGDTNPNDTPLTVDGNDGVLVQTGLQGFSSIHSNDSIITKGNSYVVQGYCSAVGTVEQSGGNNCLQGVVNGASVIPMPYWPPAQLEQNATVLPVVDGTCTIPTNTVVTGNLICNGNVDVAGNISGTGSIIAVGGNISVNGNVTAGASGVSVTLAAIPPANDPSAVENITVAGNVTVTGILYAPTGLVDIGGNTSVTGSVVGWQVNLHGDNTITYSPTQESSVPYDQVALIR